MCAILFIFIIIIHCIVFQLNFILLLATLSIASIVSNYLLAQIGRKPATDSKIEKRSCSAPDALGYTISLFAQACKSFSLFLRSIRFSAKSDGSINQDNENEHENKRARKWGLRWSSTWTSAL
jgi:hypothetical protein